MKTRSALIIALFCACSSRAADAPRIAFHFIQAEGKAFSDLKIEVRPFLTDADMLTYGWINHTMAVRPNAIARLPDMKQVGTGGKAFVVVVDGERRFRGAFWGSYSSISHFHPVILVDHYDAARVTIYRMYPTLNPTGEVEMIVDGSKVPVADPREDEALKRVLNELGKLKEPKSPNNEIQPTK